MQRQIETIYIKQKTLQGYMTFGIQTLQSCYTRVPHNQSQNELFKDSRGLGPIFHEETVLGIF